MTFDTLKTTIILFSASAFFVVAGVVSSYVSLRSISPPFVLHFNEIAGITQSGGFGDLWGAGGTALVALLINFTLALRLRKTHPEIMMSLALASLFLSLLLFVGFQVIVSAN